MTVVFFMQGSETPVERQALMAEQDMEFEKSLMIDSEKVRVVYESTGFDFSTANVFSG